MEQTKEENRTCCDACGKAYTSASGLWKHKQRCVHGLLVEQRRQHSELLEELHSQKLKLAEIAASPPVFTNTTNNILVFLNTDCSNALNWADFVAGLTVELEHDVTESIVKTVCTGIQALGMHRRPIHCVDVKHRKLYMKTNNVWENDAEKIRQAMQETHTLLENQCRTVLQAWDETRPEWYNHEKEVELYRKLAVQLVEGVDEERCTVAISRSVGL
jgi:hypothetical protein